MACHADLAAPPPGDDLPAMWQQFICVVIHGMAQLTEVAGLLTPLGESPGEIGCLACRRVDQRRPDPPALRDVDRGGGAVPSDS
jgi:hypothetical protein